MSLCDQGKMSKIEIISTSTIKVPSHTKSTARINLTPWDLQFLFLEYLQMGLLFLKPNPQRQPTVPTLIYHLKASFQRALHFFPPFSGRLSTTSSDDGAATCFFIDCSNNNDGGGALFIHAYTNLTVADILLPTYVPEILSSFFPLNGVPNFDGVFQPLLAVQVTELADGLFIGWSINHLLVDGTSFWHFLNSWAEISRSEIPKAHQIFNLPFLDRDRVILDLTGSNTISIPNQHLILDKINPIAQSQNPLKDKVVHFTKQSIVKLKARANQEMSLESKGTISSLQAVTAHIWRSIIRCRFAMNPNIQETTLKIPIAARQSLNPPLPQEYFGNAVFPGFVKLEAKKILENGLGWTAWQINRLVASCKKPDKMKECYMDWIKNPNFMQSEGLPSNYFILINFPRFNVYGNDFGWGKPVGFRSGRTNSSDGLMVISGGLEEGSMEIHVFLFPETLSTLVKDVEFMEFVSS